MLEPYTSILLIYIQAVQEVLGDHQEPDNFGTVNTGTSRSESLGRGDQGY